MKTAYISTFVIVLIMLLIQIVLLMANHLHEAETTTKAYLDQLETIIDKNNQQEKALKASLKEDYTVLAKAVSYYLDHNNDAVYDVDELQKICSLMSIDEIHIFDENGTIVSGSVPEYFGLNLNSGEQISFFLPMLTDKSLTLCQDITPNTAEDKPMVYAMTWNEKGDRLIQIGIEPVRLLKELNSHNLQNMINNISIDNNLFILITDASTDRVVAATNSSYTGKFLGEISDIDGSSVAGNTTFINCGFRDSVDRYFCSAEFFDNNYIFVFLNYNYFADQTIESLLIVIIYLMVAFFTITFIIRKLITSQEENNRHMQVFASMSEIYYSLHLIDLTTNTAVEYSAKNQVKESFEKIKGEKADVIMKAVMHATMSDEYLERGLRFTDLSTIAKRMKNKKILSRELLGKNVGWIRISFITFTENNGIPEKLIVATQVIDEEKKLTESLYQKSYLDELTKCFNRRAYEHDIPDIMGNSQGKGFSYVSLDLNGLKNVNDELGHTAGDELIIGAAECMNKAFADHGKIYRTGGDEFVAILFVDDDLINVLSRDFDKITADWKGKLVKSLSISYGFVTPSEANGMNINDISTLADHRMYEAKKKYYEENGIERRRT